MGRGAPGPAAVQTRALVAAASPGRPTRCGRTQIRGAHLFRRARVGGMARLYLELAAPRGAGAGEEREP
jgi:hypothetical protein